MNNLKTKQVTVKQVRTNATSGSYRPFFFDAEEFNLESIDFTSHFFSESDVERILLNGDFSFAYLREDKRILP